MSVNPILEKILVGRGIPLAEQEHFLRPDFYKDQYDASKMLGMDVVVSRLNKAIELAEEVLIFGDYDADGVPATALLVRTLSTLGMKVVPLIPSRAQGYGLTSVIVAEVISRAPRLLITVDNGTVAKAEIAQIADAGIDVIVIDHHEPQVGEIADRALAIINPKQENCPYEFKEMCACGLSWKVVEQLYVSRSEDVQQLKWELDLVAISTIADMVPLVGENRLFARYGLHVLQKSKNVGIRALVESAGVQIDTVSAGDVGFKIAPRINAPSRMHNELVAGVNAAVQLLITSDARQAAQLARHLTDQNTERQALVDTHLLEAERQASEMDDALVLVVFHETWSTGVIGLVASRLMDRYKRPVIALAPEDGVIKGSVRSVGAVHAVEMLEASKDELERFGGHTKAAGLTFIGDIDQFRTKLSTYVQAQGFTLADLRRAAERTAELELNLSDVTLDLCTALEEMEPFGIGFSRPLFETVCTLNGLRKVGSTGQHLSGFLTEGSVRKKAIAFQQGDRDVQDGGMYRVVYTVECETWRDVSSPVCHIQNIISLD